MNQPTDKKPEVKIQASGSAIHDSAPKLLHSKDTVMVEDIKNVANTETIIVIDKTTEHEKKEEVSSFGAPEISAIGAVFTVLASFFVARLALKKYYSDQEQQKQQRDDLLKDKAIEKAKSKIENFYGPLNSLLEESRIIYEHFALAEKKEQSKQGKRFRTLRYLTEDTNNQHSGITRLKPHDQELWNHILVISDRIIDLIEKASGHVSNPALHTLLGKLAAHYRIVKSASEGKLPNQAPYLEEIVFPLEVNGAVNSEIQKLTSIINEKEIKKINSSKTIEYYDENYVNYYHQTIDSSFMKPVYELVLCHIDYGANILDAGCGVGRDTKYFIRGGFKVTSFDASKKMVEMCNEYPFAYCEHESFNTIQYSPDFDLVWACASLLHLDEVGLQDALTRLHRALKNGGVLYFSLKSKIDNEKSKGREFYLHDYSKVVNILTNELKMTHLNSWSSFSSISDSEVFENYIFKK